MPPVPKRADNKKATKKKEQVAFRVRLFSGNGDQEHTWESNTAMTVEQAKELLGWTVAEDGEAIFKDFEGNPIKLSNNKSNRPFRMGYAKRYMLDMLRRKWKMNGEPIILDEDDQVQSGQHRLVGFILAEQERKKNEKQWAKYWKSPLVLDCLVFSGISSDREVVNTIDIGQKRTLGDVLFSDGRFPKNLPYRKRQALGNTLAGACRLVWLRGHGKTVRDAPHFPHSEALDFIDEHPGLVDSVTHIWAEDGGTEADGKLISRYISAAYASGLHYLMSTSATDPEEYQAKGPDALNFGLKDRADMFWTLFASGKLADNHPIGCLKKLLLKTEASSGMGRDEIIGMVIKSFNCYMDDKTVKPADIMVESSIDPETERKVLDEEPRLGGIDVDEIVTDRDEDGEEAEDDRVGKKKGKTWAKGDTAWVYASDQAHWFGTVDEVVKSETKGVPDTVFMKGDDGEIWEQNVKHLTLERPSPKIKGVIG